MSDFDHLRQYVRDRSLAAFAEPVALHTEAYFASAARARDCG